MKAKSSAIALICAAAATPAHAAQILTMTFTGGVSPSNYIYVPGQMFESSRIVTVTVSTPLDNFSVTDSGNTTIVQFEYGKAVINDPFSSEVGPDPIGNGVTDKDGHTYAFTYTNDYTSSFIEGLGISSSVVHYFQSDTWSYYSEIRINRYGWTRGGNGFNDYPIVGNSLIAFLNNNLNYSYVNFSSNWQYYKSNPGAGVTYYGGKSWSGSNMTFTRYSITDTSVPEPSTWLMLLLGFGIIGATLRRRPSSARFVSIA